MKSKAEKAIDTFKKKIESIANIRKMCMKCKYKSCWVLQSKEFLSMQIYDVGIRWL